MTYEQLEETQRRQITHARAAERDDHVLEVAHLWFWKESPTLGCGPCWQWPFHTLQVLEREDDARRGRNTLRVR